LMINSIHRIIATALQWRVTDDLLGVEYMDTLPDSLNFAHDVWHSDKTLDV
jgi:hypothetical protein